jgi:peptidylprolyl isomerase
MKKSSLVLAFLTFFVSVAAWAAQSQSPAPAAKTPSSSQKGATTPKAGVTHPKPAVQMTTTPSGLQYRDLLVGKGPQPKAGDTVVVNYTGRFLSGKIFDTSVGKQPFKFRLGRGEVIKGWDEGVASMHVGGKRKLVIPAGLAYGSTGYPGVIPPNSKLVFVVELLGVK